MAADNRPDVKCWPQSPHLPPAPIQSRRISPAMNTVTETVEVLKTKVVFSSSSETYQFRMQQINQGSEAGSVELRPCGLKDWHQTAATSYCEIGRKSHFTFFVLCLLEKKDFTRYLLSPKAAIPVMLMRSVVSISYIKCEYHTSAVMINTVQSLPKSVSPWPALYSGRA